MHNLLPTPAPALTAPMRAAIASGYRATMRDAEAKLERLRRQRAGALCAPLAAALMRRIAEAEADLKELGEVG